MIRAEHKISTSNAMIRFIKLLLNPARLMSDKDQRLAVDNSCCGRSRGEKWRIWGKTLAAKKVFHV